MLLLGSPGSTIRLLFFSLSAIKNAAIKIISWQLAKFLTTFHLGVEGKKAHLTASEGNPRPTKATNVRDNIYAHENMKLSS
jgi:hypothetical protein